MPDRYKDLYNFNLRFEEKTTKKDEPMRGSLAVDIVSY